MYRDIDECMGVCTCVLKVLYMIVIEDVLMCSEDVYRMCMNLLTRLVFLLRLQYRL